MSPSRKAFTLIELLVVVSIIALLVSMLLPSLGRARELTKSAICQTRLRQLHEYVQGDPANGVVTLPGAAGWVSRVSKLGGMPMTRCPSDTEPRPASKTIDDLWWWHEGHVPGGVLSNLAEIIVNGHHDPEPGYEQIFLIMVKDPDGSDVYQIMHTNPPPLPDTGSCGNLQVVIKPDYIELRALLGATGAQAQINMSITSIWEGRPSEPSSTKLLQLAGIEYYTGQFYNIVDPRSPVRLSSFPASYAFNTMVAPLAGRPDQVLLMDFNQSIADVLKERLDWTTITGDKLIYNYLAPRHVGKANAVFVDGHVAGLWPEQLDPDAAIWRP